MDIDFNLDNHKYKKIDELLKSIENRFNRVSKLEVSLENRLIKLVENYEFDESGLKITDLEAKISQVNSRVYKQKVNLKLVSGSIEQTKKMINEDLVFF
ncbi:hypothetical protein C9446_18735 [Providencia heimbachae]|nr:hypothetical protein C9446_18735 [Providencia heimbachae]